MQILLLVLVIPLLMGAGCTTETSSTDNKKSLTEDSNCHPSYSGCLKASASDYDCKSGSGDGPYYTGKVGVIGPDVFGLDRDNDGWGCE